MIFFNLLKNKKITFFGKNKKLKKNGKNGK
jgi:hypothetical protein